MIALLDAATNPGRGPPWALLLPMFPASGPYREIASRPLPSQNTRFSTRLSPLPTNGCGIAAPHRDLLRNYV